MIYVVADAAYKFSVKLYTAKQAQAAVLSIGKSRLWHEAANNQSDTRIFTHNYLFWMKCHCIQKMLKYVEVLFYLNHYIFLTKYLFHMLFIHHHRTGR